MVYLSLLVLEILFKVVASLTPIVASFLYVHLPYRKQAPCESHTLHPLSHPGNLHSPPYLKWLADASRLYSLTHLWNKLLAQSC